MKPVDVKYMLTLVKKLIRNILNLKLGTLLEHQNIFAKGCAPPLVIKKVIVVLKVKGLFKRLIKANWKKQIKKTWEFKR